MANARDFGPGKTALWALKMKWRSDLLAYGALCRIAAMTEPGTEARADAQSRCDKALLALYTHAAKLELDAQRYRETVAEEACASVQAMTDVCTRPREA